MSQLKQITEFRCALCDEIVRFDHTNEESYESQTPHDSFFGMQLTTFRVAHFAKDEKHVNTVIVDHMGLFRGLKDAYAESREEPIAAYDHTFWIVPQQNSTLRTHPYFDAVFFMNRRDYWVLELVNPSNIRILELARMVNDKLREAERMYEEIPSPITTIIANQDFRVWTDGVVCSCASLKSPAAFSSFGAVSEYILETLHRDRIPNKRLLLLALRALSAKPKIDSTLLKRLLSDDLLFTTIDFEYQSRIPSIVSRVQKRHPIAEHILTPLLRGDYSVIQLLEHGHIDSLPEVFELLDFMNRRGLLDQIEN